MNTTSTDSQYRKALEVVLTTNRASTSHFQRKLGLGYKAASQLIDLLEAKGVVGPQKDAGPRQIIAERLQFELAETKRMALVERLQKCTEELQAISVELAREPAPVNRHNTCDAATYKGGKRLPIPIGCGTSSQLTVGDLTEMPHLLVGGGNALEVNAFLRMLVDGFVSHYAKDEIQLMLIDSSSHAFESYAGDRHLIVPVITDARRVVFSFHWAVCELEKRFEMFARVSCRTIEEFNHRQERGDSPFSSLVGCEENLPATLPYIVIVVSEISDFAEQKDVFLDIGRLTAKARAAGIHLVLATGNPSTKVLNGTFKAYIPCAIAFKTKGTKESKSILDEPGAEALCGTGDCLYRGKDGRLMHLQTPAYQQA